MCGDDMAAEPAVMHVRMVTNTDPWCATLRAAVDARVNAGACFALPLMWERCQGWPENARFYVTDSAAIAALLYNWDVGGEEAVNRMLGIVR